MGIHMERSMGIPLGRPMGRTLGRTIGRLMGRPMIISMGRATGGFQETRARARQGESRHMVEWEAGFAGRGKKERGLQEWEKEVSLDPGSWIQDP